MSQAIRQDTSTQRPLSGKRIVITRARAQAENLARHIEELGGEVIEFPTIEICPPESFAAFDNAVARIEEYDWLIFTSVNSIEPFLSRLQKKGKSLAALARVKVGAIGPETAKRLEDFGIHAGLVPERYQAEGILDAVKPEDIRGKRVLIPRAAEAREILPSTLREWGAQVDVVIAYRTVLPAVDPAPLGKRLRERGVDVITFTSSSTVKNFTRLFDVTNLNDVTSGCAIACIGPITAHTVEQLGGQVAIVADEFTIPGLIRAIVAHLGSKTGAIHNGSGEPAN
jgi:uroporphyrinogen III methyltransferase/synthase